MAVSLGCVGEGGLHACPPPSTVFLAFRVTLQCHSAKFVCCSLFSALPQRPPTCPESGVPGLPQPQSSHMPVWGGGFCDGHGFPSTFFPNTYDWKPYLV